MLARPVLIATLMSLAAPAIAADAPPRWEIGEICASSALGAQCPRIESKNRSTLLLRWESLPVDARTACKTSVEGGGKPSYKLMLNCIDEQQLKTLQQDPAAHKPKDS